MNTLGPAGEKMFEERQIDLEKVVRFGIYTARALRGGKVAPDVNGQVIVFPFYEDGQVVGEKYRGPEKKFWQRPGGKRIFWNADALNDPALANGTMPLIITEGEIDALTAIDCGFPLTVSVPDGAPSGLSDLDAKEEQSGKFMFLWTAREKLKTVKRFILAVDNDAPGQRLAAELVRRLSASRCSFVEYPEGCKDLNDVRVRHGQVAVTELLNGARPYPVRGLYRLSDYPNVAELQTFLPGWSTLNDVLRLFLGELMVVSGIPGHGKSSWVMNLISNVADSYGWRAAVFSPEMPVVPHLRNKLRSIHARDMCDRLSQDELVLADAWIEEHFVFIDSSPGGEVDDEDKTLDWLLDKATEAVLRDGIRILLLDPWNELEHAKRRDETMTEYIGRGIRSVRRFAQQHQVIAIIVAHPTKDIGKDGCANAPGLYDIDGSAAWANKPDHGVSIFRPDAEQDVTEVHVNKVRFANTGRRGKVVMKYYNERYYLLDMTDAAQPLPLPAATNKRLN